MVDLVRINRKVINDPLYTPVIKFLKERIRILEEDGNRPEELALAHERYDGLVAGDLVIENPVKFSDGVTRVCFVSRKTGFARVDVDIARVDIKEIVEDFKLPLTVASTEESIKAIVEKNNGEPELLWLEYKQTFGVLLSQDQATSIDGPMKAFGDLFFENYGIHRESLTAIDLDTYESGTVTISDDSCEDGVFPLFIKELILEEMAYPEITSNLPTSLTLALGQKEVIDSKYFINLTDDITKDVKVKVTTKSGYEVGRSTEENGKLTIDVIQADPNNEIKDTMFVRVDYIYEGHPLHAVFEIAITIEKLVIGDLVMVADPEELVGIAGSVVKVNITPYYKDVVVELKEVPVSITSNDGLTVLRFDSVNKDGSITYSGALNATFPAGVDEVASVITTMFQYESVDGMVYIKLKATRPGTIPNLVLNSHTESFEGKLADTGVIEAELSYDGKVIDNKDIIFSLFGEEKDQVIKITDKVPEGIAFEVTRHSDDPGATLSTDVYVLASWRGPDRIWRSVKFPVAFRIFRDSEVVINLTKEVPIEISKYEFDKIPLQVILNNKDVTAQVNISIVPNEKDYIVITDEKSKTIQCLGTGKIAVNHELVYTFTMMVDGVEETFTQAVQYKIAAWKGDNVVIIPSEFEITGRSDDTQSVSFVVYDDRENISATAVFLEDRSTLPENVEMVGKPVYSDKTKKLTITFSKLDHSEDVGLICFSKQGDTTLDDKDIGKMNLTSNVEHSRNLQLVSKEDGRKFIVGSQGDADFELSFAGKPILLSDPNLSWERVGGTGSNTSILLVKDNRITVNNNAYVKADGTNTDIVTLQFKYKDDYDKQDKILNVSFNFIIEYPVIEVSINPNAFECRMWDKGSLNIQAKSTIRDFSGTITEIKDTTESTYIGLSGKNWTVINADKTEVTKTISVEFKYKLDGNNNYVTNTLPVKFNISAWDGRTFEITPIPNAIEHKSGETGELRFTALYKFDDVTETLELNKGSSTIPSYLLLGQPSVDLTANPVQYVIPYTTRRGGQEDIVLNMSIFDTLHSDGRQTANVIIKGNIAWPDGLNVVQMGPGSTGAGETVPNDEKNPGEIAGFYKDEINYPLIMNFAGIALPSNSQDVEISLEPTTPDVVSVKGKAAKALTVSLDQGGDKGTDYNYASVLKVKYTADGQDYQVAGEPNITIRVPEVRVGYNPSHSVKLYDHGKFTVQLQQESSAGWVPCPITSLVPVSDSHPMIEFKDGGWYIISKPTKDTEVKYPVTLGYSVGGKDYEIDVEITFNISSKEVPAFTAVLNPKITSIKGESGTTGRLKFVCTYKGYPITTGVVINNEESIIPNNLSIGTLDQNLYLPYQLVGAGNENAKLVVQYTPDASPPVIGVNRDQVLLTVETTSSNEQFTVESIGESVSGHWTTTAELPVTLKYGENTILSNAPGVKYTIVDEKNAPVALAGATSSSIFLKLNKTDGPTSTYTGKVSIKVEYNIGKPDPNNVKEVDVVITTNEAIVGNITTYPVKLWEKGTFKETVYIDKDLKIPATVTKVTFQEGFTSDKIDIVGARMWEVIGAEAETKDFVIPLVAHYQLEGKSYTIEYESTFAITGSVAPKFEVKTNTALISTSVGRAETVNYDITLKGQPVTDTAMFKADKSTIPDNLEVTSVVSTAKGLAITFIGTKGGVSKAVIAFDSVDGTESAKVNHDVQVRADFDLQVGDREVERLAASHNLTGSYKLELTSGGIPINIAEEIANGNLTFSIANKGKDDVVLSIDSWGGDTFNFKTAGIIRPGATTNVSDYITFKYKLPGTDTASLEVEIPMAYKNNKPTIAGDGSSDELAIIARKGDKKKLGTRVLCENIDITDTIVAIRNMADVVYIRYNQDNTWEAVAAPEDKDTLSKVNTAFSGTINERTWSTEIFISFMVMSLSQVRFVPYTNDKYDTSVEQTHGFGFNYKFDDKQGVIVPGFDYLDTSRSDMKGLVSFNWNRNGDWNGAPSVIYSMTALKPTTEQTRVKLCWIHQNSKTPGVEGVDFAFTTIDLNITGRSMTLSTSAIIGGNGELRNSIVTITISGKTGNVAPNSPNVGIKSLNEEMLKVKTLAASYVQFEITAPITTNDGSYKVPIEVTWTDPVTKEVVVGNADVTLTLIKPQDYPVVTNSYPESFLARLWDAGGMELFKVTIPSTKADVTAQSDIIGGMDEGYFEYTRDVPEPGNRWWFISTGTLPGEFDRNMTFIVKAPFRDGFVEIPSNKKFRYTQSLDWQKPFKVTQVPNTTGKMPTIVGREFEIVFKAFWRNRPREAGYVDSLSVVVGQEGKTVADYFDIISEDYNPASNEYKLTLKCKATLEGSIDFAIGASDVTPEEMELDKTYALSRVNFAAIDLTLLNQETPWVINHRRPNAELFKVMNGNNDYTSTTTIVDVLNGGELFTKGDGFVVPISDVPREEATGTIQLVLRLPNTFRETLVTVDYNYVIPKYDGVDFITKLVDSKGADFVNDADNPIKIVLNGVAEFHTLNTYAGASVGKLATSTSERIKAANPELSLNPLSPLYVGELLHTRVAVYQAYRGVLNIPVTYTGPTSSPVTGDVEGKNINTIQVHVWAADRILRFFPDNVEPKAVRGRHNDEVLVPCEFSWEHKEGIKANDPNIKPTLTGVGKDLFSISKVTDKGIVIKIDARNGSNITYAKRLEITWTYTYGDTTYTRVYSQAIEIEGDNTGYDIKIVNQVKPTLNVWETTDTPFEISVDGKIIDKKNYYSVDITTTKYVTKSDLWDTNNKWYKSLKVISGDTTKKLVNIPVKYEIRFTDGVAVLEQTVNTTIDINQYDGRELIVKWLNPNTAFYNAFTTPMNGAATGLLKFEVKFQGNLVGDNTSYLVWASKSKMPGYKFPAVSNTNKGNGVFEVVLNHDNKDMLNIEDGVLCFGLSGVASGSHVENVNHVLVPIPCYTYNPNRWYLRHDVENTTEVSGSYDGLSTPNVRINYGVRKGIVSENVTTDPRVKDKLNDAGDWIGTLNTAPNSGYGFIKFWFKTEYSLGKELTRNVTFSYGDGSTDLMAKQVVKVTQISNLDFPTVVDNNLLTVELNQRGGLPYRLTDDDGVDITDQAKLVDISSNEYIGLDANNWYVLNARTGDTTLMVEMTYEIVFKGQTVRVAVPVDVLVKGYNGQPEFTNVETVKGKVWDKGTKLPFDIQINGENIPSLWITKVALVTDPVGYITAGPSTDKPWQIVNGLSEESSVKGTYTVTIFNGTRTWEISQIVMFVVEAWDGSNFRVEANDNDGFNKKFNVGFLLGDDDETNKAQRFPLKGFWKGERINPLWHQSFNPVDPIQGVGIQGNNPVVNGGEFVIYNIYGKNPNNPNGVISQVNGTLRREIDSPIEEGVTTKPYSFDFIVGQPGQMHFIPNQSQTDVVGYMGDTVELDIMVLLTGTNAQELTRIDFTDPEVKVMVSNPYAIKLAEGGIKKNTIGFQFIKEFGYQKEDEAILTIVKGSLRVWINLNIIQKTKVVKKHTTSYYGINAKMWDTGSNLPFQIKDLTGKNITFNLTDVKVIPNDNVTTGLNGNVWLVNSASETEVLKVTTGFEFTVNLDDGTSYPSYDEFTFTIAAGFIPMVEILDHPENMAITKGKVEEYSIKVNYMGKPGADLLELRLTNWLKDYATVSYQNVSADKTTLTIGLMGITTAGNIQNENRTFTYGTKPAAMMQSSKNMEAITWVLDNKLNIYNEGYDIEGKVNSLQTFTKPGILLNGGRVIPWDSSDIETIITTGDVSIPENAVIAIAEVSTTKAGKIFRILPVTGSTQNGNYTNKLTYRLKSDQTKIKEMGNVYIKQLPGVAPTWDINVLETVQTARTQDFKFTLTSKDGGAEIKGGKFTTLYTRKEPLNGDALITPPTTESITWVTDHYQSSIKTGYKGDGFYISGVVDGDKWVNEVFIPVPKSEYIMKPNKGSITTNSSGATGLTITQDRGDGNIFQYGSGVIDNPKSKFGYAEWRLVGKWQTNKTYTAGFGSFTTVGKDILSFDFTPPGEKKVTLYYDMEVTAPYTMTPAETKVKILDQGGINGLPFILKYKDTFITGTITNVKVVPNDYVVAGDDGNIWKIIKADTEAKSVRTHFTFDVKIDNVVIHGIGEGDFVIQPWDGKSFEVIEQPEVIYLTNGKDESFDVKVNYMGEPGADKAELVSVVTMGSDYAIVSQTPSEDNTTLTIVLRANDNASTRIFLTSDVIYRTKPNAPLQSEQTYKSVVSSNKDVLVLYDLGQRFDGNQNRVVKSNASGRLQNGPRMVDWEDPDLIVTVKAGSYSTPTSQAIVLEWAGGVTTKAGIKSEGSPLFRILSRDNIDFNNIVSFSLKSEPSKPAINHIAWCKPTGSEAATVLNVLEPLLPNAKQTLKFSLTGNGKGSPVTFVKTENVPSGSSALLSNIKPANIKLVDDHYEVDVTTGWTGTGFTLAGTLGRAFWINKGTIQVPAAPLNTTVELVSETGNAIKVALTITQFRNGEEVPLTSGLLANLASTKGIVTPSLTDGWSEGKYVLTLTKSEKVGVDTITYNLVDGVYTYAGTFDYEVKPLYRTEPSPLDVEVFSTGSPLPFMVFGQDDLPMTAIEPKVIPNENVITGKDGNVWEIIGGPLEGGDVEAEFTFKLLINGETIDAKATGVFRIQPWDGVTLNITPIYHDENNYIPLTVGREETIKVRAMYRGAPAANSVVLESINRNGTPITFATYETLVSEDNTELTIKLSVIEGSNFMNADTNFIYSLKPEVGGSKETVVCKANCQRNALFISGLGQNFNGKNNAVVGSNTDGILMDGARYVPWDSEDIDCIIEQGVSSTADSRDICFQYAGGRWNKNTKKGTPLFRIIGTAGGTKGYQNYMTFKLLSDSTKVTTKFSAWCIVDSGSNGTWVVKTLNTLIPNTEQVLQFKLEGKGFTGESDKPIIYVKTTNNPATGRALMKPLKPSDITLEGTTYSANVHTGWTGTSFSLVGNSGNTYIEQSVISSPAATVTPTIVDNNVSAELDAETIVEFTLSQERAGLKVHEFGDTATITGLTIQSGPAKANGNGTKDGKVFKLPILGTGEEGAVRARVFVSYQDVSYTVTLNLVAVKSIPALSLSEGFQTTGEGDKSNPLTLNQSLDLG